MTTNPNFPPSTDLRAGPTVQVRDRSVLLPIPTLDDIGNEPVPAQVVKGLLEYEWIASDYAPRPNIAIKNTNVRVDLMRADQITVSMESYSEQFTGHRHEYVDVEAPVLIEIESISVKDFETAQQRTWNLFAECRRIVYKWILALKPYHSLYFDGLSESYDEGAKHAKLEVRIRLTAGAWPAFKRRSGGEQIPSIDPGMFPSGDDTGDL